MTDEKVRENRMRRMAARQGLHLQRSKRRDPLALDFGLYRLVEGNVDPASSVGYGLNLDEVERLLREGRGKG